MDNFYITTSIAYTNAPPHIGFALELIQADVISRSKREKGDEVKFLTGTDEHGLKIARKAMEEGVETQEFVDDIVKDFKELVEALNISNDDFIRTTDQKRHWPTAKKVWNKLEENGDLYKKEYTGYYCVGCEAFLTKKDLKGGKCPHHKKKPEKVKEDNYFFKLSKYEEEIKELIKEDKVKVTPEGKKKEILTFIEEGLQDISVSRSTDKLTWGIPVPGDENQRMYVWVDALSNYLSALDFANEGEEFKKFWPANVHCIGKDILRFHSVIWIGILLSAGLKVPENIFVHGFLTSKGQKMSKSLGNVINPFDVIEKYGSEALRYYLLAEINPTGDGDFTYQKMKNRYNADLADGLGNLISRTMGLAKKKNIDFDPERKPGNEIRKAVKKAEEETEQFMDDFELRKAIERIWDLIHFTDRYIEEKKPWEETWEQEKTIFEMLYVCYHLHGLLKPFLPETAERIKKQIEKGEKVILFEKI
jgi:methionyl-tRNA synthetase